MRLRWWLLGALLGLELLWLARYQPLVLIAGAAVLGVLALRSPERAAFGGGALVATGILFLAGSRAAVERCAEIDRGPSGLCQIYGVEEQAIAMGLYLAVGVGLSLYAALRRRSRPPAGADRSAAAPTRR
ncbi:MAG TPA: hypothetical protein VGQ86_03950 [Candidatus Limnocylindria bacterium]|nr:hypothetical protein [Candidatus Limnocylindria bacterium]